MKIEIKKPATPTTDPIVGHVYYHRVQESYWLACDTKDGVTLQGLSTYYGRPWLSHKGFGSESQSFVCCGPLASFITEE